MGLNIDAVLPDVWPCEIEIRKRSGPMKFSFFVREPGFDEVCEEINAKAKSDADKAVAGALNEEPPLQGDSIRQSAREAIEKYVVSDEQGTVLTEVEVKSMLKLSTKALADIQTKIKEVIGLSAPAEEAKNA